MRMTAPAVRSLRRERLLETLGGVSEGRLALVIAPAGSGKTTLLAEFADSSPLPVAWYRAETDDAATGVILHGLATALEPVLATAVAPDSVDDLIAAAD